MKNLYFTFEFFLRSILGRFFSFSRKGAFEKSDCELFSVIIPTIWGPKPDFIFRLLRDLNESPFVGEILLVDNAIDKCPRIQPIEKLRYLPQASNIYVNPAWNLGVLNSKYNRVVLCNDDINTDWSVLGHVNSIMHRNKMVGILGLGEGCLGAIERNLQFRFVSSRPNGFGCCMFLDRDLYSYIPEFIKIFSGDTWIFEYSKTKGRINAVIEGWPVAMADCRISVSSNAAEFSEIKRRDVISYQNARNSLTAQSSFLTNEAILKNLQEISAELRAINKSMSAGR